MGTIEGEIQGLGSFKLTGLDYLNLTSDFISDKLILTQLLQQTRFTKLNRINIKVN